VLCRTLVSFCRSLANVPFGFYAGGGFRQVSSSFLVAASTRSLRSVKPP
jgi:hypothetical protein